MGIGLSLSGIYNIGHDVGGFAGPTPEPELFIRWIQNGIFHPRFTIHSWNDDGTVNVPWMYQELLEPIRELMIFRMQLVPYLYDLLYRAHAKYEPMIRPTFYNYESDARTFVENDEFMLGKNLLIASVFKKGQRTRSLYLPNDPNGWYEYHSSIWYAGGRDVTVDAPLKQATFFVRGGSILPLNPAVQGFETKEAEARKYIIHPVRGGGEFEASFYEDDGKTMAYEKGSYAFVKMNVLCDEETITVRHEITGEYKPQFSDIQFELPKTETRRLVCE